MPKTASAALPVATSDIERRKQDAAQEADISLAGAALSTTFPAMLVRQGSRSGMQTDPSFFLTADRVKELGQGIDPSLWGRFADASSEDDANLIRFQLLDQQAAEDRLNQAGFYGTAARMTAALTDPVVFGASIVTGGLGSAAALSGSAGRVAMLGRAGIIGALPAVGLETYRASQDPRVTGYDIASAALGGLGQAYAAQAFAGAGRAARFAAGGVGSVAGAPIDALHAATSDDYGVGDVLFNMATNFAVGGIGNALPGNQKLAEAAERVIRNVQYADVQKAAQAAGVEPKLTPKGEAYFKAQQEPAREPQTLAEAMGLEPATGEVVEAGSHRLSENTENTAPMGATSDPATAMGAASPNDPAFDPDAAVPLPKQAGDLDLSGASTAKSIRGWTWLGPVGKYVLEPIGVRVGQSIVPTWRRISAMLAKDVLPREGNTPSILSAPEWADSQASRYVGEIHLTFDAGYKAHKKAAGKNAMTFEEFRNEVAKARRRQGQHQDANVAATAKALSKHASDLLGLQQRMGVQGAGRVQDSDSYVPRFGHRGKIDAAIDAHGYEAVVDGVQQLIALKLPDLSPTVHKAMAEAWVRNAGSNNTSFDAERALLWEEAGPRQLAAFLRQYAPDITDDELIAALTELKEAGAEASTPTQLRSRIFMDETARVSITSKNGQQVDFGIEDLLENDALHLMVKYAHKAVRASAMAEVYRVASQGLPRHVKSIPDLLALLREEAMVDPKNVKSDGSLIDELESQLELIEHMAKQTAGIPTGSQTRAAKWWQSAARTVKNLNYVKSMSSYISGIRNFTEFVHSISEQGLGATFRAIPQAASLVNQIRKGEITSQLRKELHAVGIGFDRIAHRIVSGTIVEDGVNVDAVTMAERVSAKGARLAGDVSMQSGGTVLMNELTGLLILQKWADIARSGRMLSDKRLAGLGLDRAMADRVTKMLKDNAVYDKSGAVLEVNSHQWEDVEAATAFRAALTKEATRLIQKNNATEYAGWMTSDIGKLLMQLRSFSYGNWRGKLLYDVRMADWKTFQNIASYTAVGSVVYALTTYLDSIGREDQQEWLDKRLSTRSLALATFARSSYSALLPTFVDAGLEATGNDPAFGFQRTTGLPSAALFGNPTWDWANAASKLPAIVTAPFRDDYDFSRQDVENMKKGLWIPNFPPLVRIIEQLTKNLPDRSKN